MRWLPIAIILITACKSSFVGVQNEALKLPKSFTERFAYIPTEGDSAAGRWMYMARYEVSNAEYREFVREPYLSGNITLYQTIKVVDTTKVTDYFMYGEPMTRVVHNHPAFDHYPIARITHRAARLYCEWLKRQLQAEYHGLNFECMLPTRDLWLNATLNGRPRLDTIDSSKGYWVIYNEYACGGNDLMDREGNYLCNFRQVDNRKVTWNSDAGDYVVMDSNTHYYFETYLAPVSSYPPSPYGLYNMNGNVAEMVTDSTIAVGGCWNSPGYDVRNESVMKFDGPSVYVGFRPVVFVSKKP